MKNYKQDDVGYCINITPNNIDILKLPKNDLVFTREQNKLEFIKGLIDFKGDDTQDFLIDAATNQFSDRAIDVFVDDESLIKGYPLVARTKKGIPLHGNLVIIASDSYGNSILLTKQQVETALNELSFTKTMPKREVDLFDLAIFAEATTDHPGSVKETINLLMHYCIIEDRQILCRIAPLRGDKDITAITLVYQGDRRTVEALYVGIINLINSHRYKQ